MGAYELVTARLTALCGRTNGSGDWPCPAHQDRNPSLSVNRGDKGVVLHCHAGCNTDDILQRLGLTKADLYDTDQSEQSHITSTYDYLNENGQLVYQVVRFTPKAFRQRRPNSQGGWIWNMQGVRRILYNLPDVLAAKAANQPIALCEGEKDADAVNKAGRTATTMPGGVDKWNHSYTETLNGARVVIIADRDTPGRKHAWHVHAALTSSNIETFVVEPPEPYKDVAELLAAGGQLSDLIDVTTSDPPEEPDTEEQAPTSWRPVDLTDALAGADIEPPVMCERSDGLKLVYAGRVHWFQGEPESLKSWAAQIIAAEQLQANRNVLYIDFEDDDRGIVARLKALSVPNEAIANHLCYIRPDEPLKDRFGTITLAWDDFAQAIDRNYTLCIIDGVTEAMTTEGLDPNKNVDAATWMRLLPKRLTTDNCAVIVVDHVVKDRDTQGRYAIGAQHKLAGVTGATYRFTVMRPFARAWGADPVEGVVAVTVEKDRPGYVRARAIDQHKIGTLTLTSYPDGGIGWSLDPPGTAKEVDWAVVQRIAEHLSVYDGTAKKGIEDSVEGKAVTIRTALKWMAENSYLTVEQKGTAHLHYLTDKGRKETETT